MSSNSDFGTSEKNQSNESLKNRNTIVLSKKDFDKVINMLSTIYDFIDQRIPAVEIFFNGHKLNMMLKGEISISFTQLQPLKVTDPEYYFHEFYDLSDIIRNYKNEKNLSDDLVNLCISDNGTISFK